MKKIAISIGVLALVAAGIWIGWSLQPATSPSEPRWNRLDAEQALAAGDYSSALAICEHLLEKTPQSIALRMTAGEAAARCDEFEKALAHYAKIPERLPEGAVARWAMAQIYYQLGKPREALRALDESSRIDPGFPSAHEAAVAILNTLGRRRETLPHLLKLFQFDYATVEHLLQVGNLSKSIFAPAELERIGKLNPDDRSVNLPLAIHAREQGDFVEARELLDALIAQQPELLEARVQQGWLLQSVDPTAMAAWSDALPGEAFENADVWYLMGQAAQLRGDVKPAIRCSLEAIVRDPDHLPAHLAVAQLIQRDGHSDRAQSFGHRAELLQRLNLALEQIYTSRSHLPPIEEAARLAYELGRMWEAIGWSAHALSIDSKLEWPRSILEQVRPRIEHTSPRTLPEYNLAALAAWKQEYPLPARTRAKPVEAAMPIISSAHGDGAEQGRVAFEDIAEAAGIHFVLAQPASSHDSGKRMFEFTGAGAGAIDYDADGWCDLYLVQASTSPPGSPNSANANSVGIPPSDRLLRSLGTSGATACVQFDDVSAAARIQEADFGQGLAVADVNCDGFDDVYVCNFGRNQLWLNQGDGTFGNGSELFPADEVPQWTVSAAIADVDLDGRPEIYDANYVAGDDVLTKLCDVAGKPRVCPPLVFAPAPHALWLPDAQGRFHKFAGDGAELLEGYGLGVVAFLASDSSEPQIFVAIDQQANLLLTTHRNAASKDDAEAGGRTERDDDLALRNEAIVRGVAFDAAGRSQACMGIAAGDVNFDGQIDLYVTNFYNESNTLYLQDAGFYRDATAEYSLVAPSVPALGFGAQFLDCELDGRGDIVVLNGHIDDLTHIGAPYRMRPQLYHQASTGKFREVSGEAAGAFFARPALGRALAKADFNRDGLEDLVATDLEAPLALLENRSQAVGKSVTVWLVGTKSDRNALFTQATLSGADFQQKRQLVAGGGYMASNERCLRFSAPANASPLTLELEWPRGTRETCGGLQAGYGYVVVEGRGIVQSFSSESN